MSTEGNLKVTLDRLPLELLWPIMALLERRDLKSLRLMNRTLRQVASENFFESIIVSRTQPSSLGQLKNISETPFWASQVRSIDWTPSDFHHVRLKDYTLGDHESDQQCRYLRLLPSVKYVRISTTAVDRWCDNYEPPYTDFFALIALAELKPSVLKTSDLTFELKYDGDGYITELSVRARVLMSYRKAIQDFAIPAIPGRTPLRNPVVFQSITGYDKFRPTKCSMIDTLLPMNREWRLLLENPALKQLTLKNVQLMAGPKKDPLDEFLNIAKHRGTSSNTQGVAVNLVKISKAGFKGSINAKSEDIVRWINDHDSWLAEKKASFKKLRPQSPSDRNMGMGIGFDDPSFDPSDYF